jgi:hypothetical protein
MLHQNIDSSTQSTLMRTDTDLKLDHSANIYKSCCGGSSDKRLITLLVQVGISVLTILFSAAMLAFSAHEDRAIYMSLISSILSFWLGKSDIRSD